MDVAVSIALLGSSNSSNSSNTSTTVSPVLNRTDREQSVLRGFAMAAQALLLLAIFLLSSLGNSAVVLVILKQRQLRTVTNAFILSLSLSDALTAALCLPFSFLTLLREDGLWAFGDGFCLANGFVNTCSAVVSTLTLTLISFDRYSAIVRQPRQKIGRRKAAQLLAAVWLGAVALSLPWCLLPRPAHAHAPHAPPPRCTYVFHPGGSRLAAAYGASLIAGGFLLPFALMCFCHYNICRAVRLSEVRVRPVTTYAHLLRCYSETRTATTVLLMILFIIFCWGPFCLLGLLAATGGRAPAHPAMDTAAAWMAWANGAINPLIYAARNPNISLLPGRRREEGYRTRSAASAQTQGRGGAGVAERGGGERHGGRLSSSGPASGGEAMWACKNPAVLFCRDGRPDDAQPAPPKAETADTSL